MIKTHWCPSFKKMTKDSLGHRTHLARFYQLSGYSSGYTSVISWLYFTFVYPSIWQNRVLKNKRVKQESPTFSLPHTLQGQQVGSSCLDFGFTFMQQICGMCLWNRQERACAGGIQVCAARRIRDNLPFWICCSTSFISHHFSACTTLIINTYLGLLTTDQGDLSYKDLPKSSMMWKQTALQGIYMTRKIHRNYFLCKLLVRNHCKGQKAPLRLVPSPPDSADLL